MRHFPRAAVLAVLALLVAAAPAAADVVVADTQIVQGSQCVGGADCVFGEFAGSGDTQRLKSLRPILNFADTSTAVGDPTVDWSLIANDDAGGLSRFLLQDLSTNKVPFDIRAGNPSNALVVAGGKIGLGTGTPGLHLNLKDGDTPGVRLEQDNTVGFNPQTWDVAGNEANFFVRDTTHAPVTLPFRIRPGAPTSSIDIAASGNVGFGTNVPQQALHVRRTDGSTRVLVEEASSTPATRILADLSNRGPVQMRFSDTAPGATNWLAGMRDDTNFAVAPSGASFAPLTVRPGGDVVAAGTLAQGADPAGSENEQPVDGDAILTSLRSLPLATREYTADTSNARHLWPSAADFSAAFGLGANDGSVAPGDMGGVALAAVKALDARVSTIALTPGPKGDTGAQGTSGQNGAVATIPASVSTRLKRLEKDNKSLSKQLRNVRKTLARLAKKK
jgi:hypothetical protein